jgi:hypothetical protein
MRSENLFALRGALIEEARALHDASREELRRVEGAN